MYNWDRKMMKVFTLWEKKHRDPIKGDFGDGEWKLGKKLQIKWELKSRHTHLISENFWKGSSWEKQRARNQNFFSDISLPRPKNYRWGRGESIIWGWCEHTNWQAGEWVTEGTYKVNNIPSAGRNYLYINHSPSGRELERLPTPQWP